MPESNSSRAVIWLMILLLLVSAPSLLLAKRKKPKDPARRMYAMKCGGACHRLYKPSEYDGKRWLEILPDMAERAKLTETETETIEKYLLANAAGDVESELPEKAE